MREDFVNIALSTNVNEYIQTQLTFLYRYYYKWKLMKSGYADILQQMANFVD
jgi:hypothetical protein